MERVAIIGTGVAGLGCAWNLRHHAALTLLEQDQRPGGHSNTVTVDENNRPLRIDTGFIVFNKVTYPNLCRLFAELDVPIKPSEMSFSVQHLPTGLEYNGMGLNKIFAQRRNLFRSRFHRLLADIQRFFRIAEKVLTDGGIDPRLTIGEFANHHQLSEDFLVLYLQPMSSAVWSTEPRDILGFPASTLLHFFHNHGFLGVDTHHPWFTVEGGAKTYVDRILAGLAASQPGAEVPRLKAQVTRVTEQNESVEVTLADGQGLPFDRVVLAAHADQSLAMLAAPDADQLRLLSPFRYQENHATLHTDASVMPKARRAWASWNHRIGGSNDQPLATTHYWMNALQGIPPGRNYFVSLNCQGQIPADHILYETVYHHPVFNLEAVQAQDELSGLNRRSRSQKIFFCGSYFKYGFHEDAYRSGLELAEHLKPILKSEQPHAKAAKEAKETPET